MKKLLLAVLVSGLSFGSAQAAPSIYGELDVSVDRIDNEKPISDTWKVDSNNSLIGVKGDEKLTDALSVFYLAEWTVNGDEGSTDLTSRNRYVGLKHDKLGSLKIGKFDTYVKKLGGVDLFDNYVANTLDINGTLTGENRLDNTVSYETPAFKVLGGDVQWNALISPGEDTASGTLVANGQASGKSLADAWSTSVTFKNDAGLSAGLGYDQAVPSRWLAAGSAYAETNTLRASGSFNIKEIGLSLRALVQRAEVEESKTASANNAKVAQIDDETAFIVGAAYQIPNFEKVSIKAQYNKATTSFKDSTKDYDIDQIALGVDYAFNSRTRAYSFLAQNTKDNGTTDTKTRYGGVGLEYKF